MLKKIKTKERIEREKRIKTIILGILLVSLLVISSFGYAIYSLDPSSRQKSVFEKGHKFTKNMDLWVLDIQGQKFYFHNLPSEVENISVNGSIKFESYYSKPLYLVNSSTYSSIILYNLDKYILRHQEACINPEECKERNLPLKNCSNNIIIFVQSEEEKIEVDENCVYLYGQGSRVIDAFLYKVFDIN